jgi:hypothetical protein
MSPWGNGWDYFIWGTIAALTGPPAYFIFKRIYGGENALAAEASALAADDAPSPAPAATAVLRPAAD